jgi:hypothetical protein
MDATVAPEQRERAGDPHRFWTETMKTMTTLLDEVPSAEGSA